MIFLLLLPVLILVPYLNQVLFAPGSNYTDLLISHYPNALYIREILTNWHQIPLWSSQILSGYPFSSDPLSGLWYIPGWLAVILPLPFAFNLALGLHLLWGGFGMYRWLKLEKLGPVPAMLGALAFESMPKIWAHMAAGHVTLIYAVAWTPWLLWAEKRSATYIGKRNIIFSPGIILGIICLADPRWAAYAGVLWLGYSLWQRAVQSRSEIFEPENRNRWFRRVLRFLSQSGAHILFQGLMALMIAAPLLLPLIQYSSLSTRSLMTVEDSLTLALPVGNLLGLIIPNPGGYAEWIVYPTAGVLILASIALFLPSTWRRSWFWWIVAAFSLLFSLGSVIPLVEKLAALPGFDLLRVPSRAIFLMEFGLIVIAAIGLQGLIEPLYLEEGRKRRNPLILAFALFVFVGILGAGIYILQHSLEFSFLWAVLSFALAFLAAVLIRKQANFRNQFGMVFVALIVIDAGVVNRLSFEPREIASFDTDARSIASYMSSQPGTFRVYSPSYSLPQNIAAEWGLQLADGVDPLQLTSYVDYMKRATGVPSDGYSVTLPAYANGTPETDNQAYLPDLQLLGLLNVKYLVAQYDLDEAGIPVKARFGSTRVYENPYALGEAWIQPTDAPLGAGAKPVSANRTGANEITLIASGPGLLVLSEISYPGWQVIVDGVKSEAMTAGGLLRAVELESGPHQIRFVYQPFDVYAGAALSILAWVVIFIAQIGVNIRRRKQKRLPVVEEHYSEVDPNF